MGLPLSPVLSVHPRQVKVRERVTSNPEEPLDMKDLQKELQQFAKMLKQKRVTLGYTQADGGITLSVVFGKVQPDLPL